MRITQAGTTGGLRIGMMLMLALLLAASPACKSKKKLLAEQQAREQADLAARTDRAISELEALQANTSMSVDEKERRLFALKDRYGDSKDPAVLSLFEQIASDIAKARAEKKAQADELAEAEAAAEAKAKLETRKPKLSQAFSNIATASTRGEANNSIKEALSLFARSDAPVLIVISEAGGMVDYDRPTTIEKYLNYLKDTRTNTNRIKNVELDVNGKIVELELIKVN